MGGAAPSGGMIAVLFAWCAWSIGFATYFTAKLNTERNTVVAQMLQGFALLIAGLLLAQPVAIACFYAYAKYL